MNLRKARALIQMEDMCTSPPIVHQGQNVLSTSLSMAAFREGKYTRVSIANRLFSPIIDISTYCNLKVNWKCLYCRRCLLLTAK